MRQIFIGACSGLFSGIGMGGGTILILLLTTISGIEQHIAQATNLIYFIPTAISAIIANYKNKIIDFKLAITISVFGVIGAIIGAIISVNTDVKVLNKIFGIFLIIITINEIYTLIKEYKYQKSWDNKNRKITLEGGRKYEIC